MGDCKLKLREIADTLKISEASVFTILQESLGMRKLFLKWVPRFLTPDQKQQRVEDSERCLELFKRGKKDFLHRYVTMDETWIHYYTPETKISPAEWTAVSESRLKRLQTQQWVGKVMASVFWNAYGILFIDYLKKGIVYYVPMCIMKVITRRATMLAGDQSRGAISPASILSESRNYPNCVHWRIFYFM